LLFPKNYRPADLRISLTINQKPVIDNIIPITNGKLVVKRDFNVSIPVVACALTSVNTSASAVANACQLLKNKGIL